MIHPVPIGHRPFLLALNLVWACVGAFAQANSELSGIVTDQTGAVVAGAKIVLIDPATELSKTTESGSTGLYNISGLNPANYNLKVTANGFGAFVQNGIAINVSSNSRVNVKLTVGAESQTVTVEAGALTVQTDSNVVSTVISSNQINEIATENRNFAALSALGLGVSSALPDNNPPSSGSLGLSMNGLNPNHNIWLIDGGESDDRGAGGGMAITPSQDAIAEFTVLSSNYPPDYGISSGATMSLSLKSGTKTSTASSSNSIATRPTTRTATSISCRPRSPVAPPSTTTSLAATSADRSSFRTSTTPVDRRPSSSGTKNGARSSTVPAQTYRTPSIHPTFPRPARISPTSLPDSARSRARLIRVCSN